MPAVRVLFALHSLCNQLDEARWTAIITVSWRAGEVEERRVNDFALWWKM